MNVHTFNLDLCSAEPNDSGIKIKQFSYGNDKFNIYLFSGNEKFNPADSFSEITLRFIRPDGRFNERYIWKKDDEELSSNLSAGDDSVMLSFNTKPFELYRAGEVKFELIFYLINDDGSIEKKLISSCVTFDVYKSLSSFNLIEKKSLDIIDELISEVKALQVTVNYEEYINMLEKAISDIANNSEKISSNTNSINELNETTQETFSELLIRLQNCDNEIEGLNDDVDHLQGLIEENKGEESYNPQSLKAQSGKAVAQAVAGIVDSAPETLNTLEELAKALGNDPNFATSIMTLLGGKVDKESGKTLSSNDFSDEDKEAINYLSQQHEIFLNELGTSVYPAIEGKVDKEDSFGLMSVEPYFDPESDEEDPYTWDKAELTNHFYDSYENTITERGVTVYSAEGADKRLAEKIDKTSIITTLEDADANHDNNNVIPSIPFLLHNFISEGRIAESKEAIWDTQVQIPCIELVIQLINSAIGDALEADY